MRVRFKSLKVNRRKVIAVIAKKVRNFMRRNVPVAQFNAQRVMRRWISASQEIQSIRSGRLKVEFGLSDSMAESAADAIVDAWANSLSIQNFNITDRLTGGFDISAVKRNTEEISNILQGSYVSPSSGETISWLKWLLQEGDTIRIVGWRVLYKDGGRSGGGIMVKSKSRFWEIPEPFNKSSQNNFLVQIIEDPRFQREIKIAIASGIKGIVV